MLRSVESAAPRPSSVSNGVPETSTPEGNAGHRTRARRADLSCDVHRSSCGWVVGVVNPQNDQIGFHFTGFFHDPTRRLSGNHRHHIIIMTCKQLVAKAPHLALRLVPCGQRFRHQPSLRALRRGLRHDVKEIQTSLEVGRDLRGVMKCRFANRRKIRRKENAPYGELPPHTLKGARTNRVPTRPAADQDTFFACRLVCAKDVIALVAGPANRDKLKSWRISYTRFPFAASKRQFVVEWESHSPGHRFCLVLSAWAFRLIRENSATNKLRMELPSGWLHGQPR